MKPILSTLAAVFLTVSGYAQTDHDLERLWKSYDRTEKEDKPKDGLAILEKIKSEALRTRSSWDYFRACDNYRDLKVRINWKDRQSASDAFEKEIEDYADPVAGFYFRRYRKYNTSEELKKFVLDNRRKLQKGYNAEFYRNDHSITGSICPEVLLPLIENDWQYVLWSLFLSGEKMEESYGFDAGRYPLDALADYTLAIRSQDETEAMAAFVEKYSGKAAALLGRDWLLSLRFNELQRNVDKSSEPMFKALREDCAALVKDGKSFTGEEKKIALSCTLASEIATNLDAGSVCVGSASFENVVLHLKNVSRLEMKISSSGKKVLEEKVVNPVCSYFVPDTVAVGIPAMDDGLYEIEFAYDGRKETARYSRFSLSLSVREDAAGYSVYAADCSSGRPLEKCSVDLFSGSSLIESAEDLMLDGFTPLPASISERLRESRGSCSLQVRLRADNGAGRLSPVRNVYSYSRNSNATVKAQKHALILTDRRAFNPSDTLKFKAIAYEGVYEHEMSREGVLLKAVLSDADGKEVGSCGLTTNEFGSVAGSFIVTDGFKNGWWTLSVREGDTLLASEGLRVDEFVLPTFSLSWDEDSSLHLSGDEISLSGRIRSYSGHSLTSSSVTPVVEGPSLSGEPSLSIDEDGRFCLTFRTLDSKYAETYHIFIRIADATGETMEFGNMVWVQPLLILNPVLLNPAKGSFRPGSSDHVAMGVISGERAEVDLSMESMTRKGLRVKYTLTRDRALVLSGEADAADILSLDLSGQPSGLYCFEASAEEGSRKACFSGCFIKASDGDDALDADIEWFFKDTEGEDIAIQVGQTRGPLWVVAELFDGSRHLLDHKLVRLDGVKGASGSLQTISFGRPNPGTLVMKLFAFRDSRCREYSRTFEEIRQPETLPLSFSRFLDTTLPGARCTFSVKTSPGVECAASVFDISTETVVPNRWAAASPLAPMPEYPSYSSVCGDAGCVMFGEAGILRADAAMKVGGLGAAAPVLNDNICLEESAGEDSFAGYSEETSGPATRVRENFSGVSFWDPFLRSDKDGNISLNFTNSDRLSTYAVQLFAHDKDFRNASIRREMVVTLPVKVSLVEPRTLRESDKYIARVTLSNSTGEDVTGQCSVTVCNGPDKSDVISSFDAEVRVPARGSAVFCPPGIDVRQSPRGLGFLVSFKAGEASDAVFMCVPVNPGVQTVTEAHSSLLKAGEDRNDILSTVRSQFVNVDGGLADVREISILDMLREAVPERVEPSSDNLMSLSEACYANLLARSLGASGLSDGELSDVRSRILDCRNPDGGYAWFKGMRSSPIITAVLLQRLARMSALDSGISGSFFQEEAVKYLDKSFLGQPVPLWCGALSLEQYLHVRSLYPEVEFDVKSLKARDLKQLRKKIKAYLVPSRDRGPGGMVFAKALRLATLRNLSCGGSSLAKAWGIRFSPAMRKSASADIASLLQYAVRHRSGGCYFPNAVMPSRGLLESELYAHVLLCDLLSEYDVAEGIRLWIMVQKETQSWGTDPAYLEALACVQNAGQETLATKVMVLSAEYTTAFENIKAAGNGFTIERKFIREDGTPVNEGDSLTVGEKIKAEYRIWNGENRSFVLLSAPRPSSLRPIMQLSGHYGWPFRPLRLDGSMTVTPQGYRSVLADCTQYWFDTYPEENTVISEEFFVSQSGLFHSPVPQIESLYAPHYRANGESSPLVSR